MELKHDIITQKLQIIVFFAVFLTLYVHMSKCCFINVKNKHKERLIIDRLFVRVYLRLLNFPKIILIPQVQYPPI